MVVGVNQFRSKTTNRLALINLFNTIPVTFPNS
jgi:hypothetical protein